MFRKLLTLDQLVEACNKIIPQDGENDALRLRLEEFKPDAVLTFKEQSFERQKEIIDNARLLHYELLHFQQTKINKKGKDDDDKITLLPDNYSNLYHLLLFLSYHFPYNNIDDKNEVLCPLSKQKLTIANCFVSANGYWYSLEYLLEALKKNSDELDRHLIMEDIEYLRRIQTIRSDKIISDAEFTGLPKAAFTAGIILTAIILFAAGVFVVSLGGVYLLGLIAIIAGAEVVGLLCIGLCVELYHVGAFLYSLLPVSSSERADLLLFKEPKEPLVDRKLQRACKADIDNDLKKVADPVVLLQAASKKAPQAAKSEQDTSLPQPGTSPEKFTLLSGLQSQPQISPETPPESSSPDASSSKENSAKGFDNKT
jgi:hypothetical protein